MHSALLMGLKVKRRVFFFQERNAQADETWEQLKKWNLIGPVPWPRGSPAPRKCQQLEPKLRSIKACNTCSPPAAPPKYPTQVR